MKKIYMKPELEVVKVKMPSHLMEASNATLSIEVEDEITTSDDFGSRFFDFDDEGDY